MFKHVVVGSDASPEGSDALVLGAELAAASGAALHLAGVFSQPLFSMPAMSDHRTLQEQLERALDAQRRQFAPMATVQTLGSSSHTRGLIHFAQRVHADVIVVGSSAEAPAGHCGIGRHARQLLHHAPHALAIAKRGLHELDAGLHSIGVGYDGDPESLAAFQLASELSSNAGAELRGITVVEEGFPALHWSEWMTVDWESLREELRAGALARANRIAADMDSRAEVVATVGDPGLELRRWSETVDLMVVGSRRWGPIARLVSGSVGETLIADAGSSVMIVPRPHADKQRRHRSPSAEHAHT